MPEKEEKKIINEETAKKIKDEIQKSIDLNKVEDLVKKSEIEFEYKKVNYRVRQPTFKEKQEAYQQRIKKYTELLQNDEFMLEEDLKAQYKKRGIDIDKMTSEINQLETDKSNFKFKLGKLLKEKKGTEKDKQALTKEIEDITSRQQLISIKKTNLLQFSIESQSLIYVYSYITYLITEKKVEDKWVKAFGSYEKFTNSLDELVNRASWYASLVMGQL